MHLATKVIYSGDVQISETPWVKAEYRGLHPYKIWWHFNTTNLGGPAAAYLCTGIYCANNSGGTNPVRMAFSQPSESGSGYTTSLSAQIWGSGLSGQAGAIITTTHSNTSAVYGGEWNMLLPLPYYSIAITHNSRTGTMTVTECAMYEIDEQHRR